MVVNMGDILESFLRVAMVVFIVGPLTHMTQSTVKGHNGPADRLQSVGGACR